MAQVFVRRAIEAALVLGMLALLVGVAVVELGWHYATDVIGGLAVAGRPRTVMCQQGIAALSAGAPPSSTESTKTIR